MYYTANPGGPGHQWFKRLFIDREYRNKEKPEDYVFIPATVYDNTVLMQNNPEYLENLENLPDDLRKAYLDGRWDLFAGQYFTDFNPKVHVIKPFKIPDNWRRYFTMDYGLDMLAGYWIAMDEYGRAYVYREIHKSELRVGRAAEEIIKAEDGDRIYDRIAPPDLYHRGNQTGRSTIEMMGDFGLYFSQSKNDRVQGWYELAEWLAPYKDEQDQLIANLRIFETCPFLIRHIPALQHATKGDPNDIQDSSPEEHKITHAPDAIRYFVTGRPMATEVLHTHKKVQWEDDMHEDYDHASEADKLKLIEKWGNPF
jgi:phage terminase large subunit